MLEIKTSSTQYVIDKNVLKPCITNQAKFIASELSTIMLNYLVLLQILKLYAGGEKSFIPSCVFVK